MGIVVKSCKNNHYVCLVHPFDPLTSQDRLVSGYAVKRTKGGVPHKVRKFCCIALRSQPPDNASIKVQSSQHNTNKHTSTHAHSTTQTSTQAHKHTSTQAHKHTSTHAHKHTSTQAHQHTSTPAHQPAHQHTSTNKECSVSVLVCWRAGVVCR